jgi:hypothetical protein
MTATKTKPEIRVDIKPTGAESIVVYAPFDEAYEALIESGYEVISLPQNAQLRIQQGRNSYISRNGNWTREGIIYIPGEKPKLVKDSPVLYSPKEATKEHRNGKEYFLNNEQVEQALGASADFPAENIEVPTDGFDSEDLTVYAFGGEKEAGTYGEFLRNAGIKKMPVLVVDKDYVNKQSQPFVRQVWFRNLDDRSDLLGYARYLDYDYGLRGVKKGAEGTAQKSEGEAYNPKQISKALKALGFSGLEETLLQKLKQ